MLKTGYSAAADAIFSALHSELHRPAKHGLTRRLAPRSLSVSTPLPEAYLYMLARADSSFPGRARFRGYVTRVMRGRIIDHADSCSAIKLGDSVEAMALEGLVAGNFACTKELSAVSDALDELAKVEPELVEIIDLKFFCGCSFPEMASLHNLSERTLHRKWHKARIYLQSPRYRHLPRRNGCPN